MKKNTNFFGKLEEVPEDLYKLCSAAPPVVILPLINEKSGDPIARGCIQIHQRGQACLAQNAHDPRPFILCWNNNNRYTDISLHREMGGEHGALNTMRKMFERYARR